MQTAIVLAVVILPLVPIVGHLVGVSELHSFSDRLGTALHAAAVLLLLSCGVAAATHESAVLLLLRGAGSRDDAAPAAAAAGRAAAAAVRGRQHRGAPPGLLQVHVGLMVYVS